MKLLVRQTLPLILAYVDNGRPIEGRTRFQKMIFLLHKQTPFFKQKYDFVAHNYGPYSSELQNDIDDLIREGFLVGSFKTVEEGKIKYDYSITSIGASLITKLLANKDLNKKFKFSKILNLAEQIKNNVNTKDLSSVLSEIYQQYPDFAKRSKYQF